MSLKSDNKLEDRLFALRQDTFARWFVLPMAFVNEFEELMDADSSDGVTAFWKLDSPIPWWAEQVKDLKKLQFLNWREVE